MIWFLSFDVFDLSIFPFKTTKGQYPLWSLETGQGRQGRHRHSHPNRDEGQGRQRRQWDDVRWDVKRVEWVQQLLAVVVKLLECCQAQSRGWSGAAAKSLA